MEVLIIGGAGFIGSNLASFFAKMGEKVTTIDIKEQKKDILELGVKHYTFDITDFNKLKPHLDAPDIIIYTAIIQIPFINEQKELAYNVNIRTLQNVCEHVMKSDKVKGVLLTGSWHVIGEYGIEGKIDESCALRPDKVDERAKLYALHKIIQESIMRTFDYISNEKIFGVIRVGTVLGEGMPEKTAANIFINQALKGENLTPYKSNMYRPMIYVSINDVVKAFYNYAKKIVNNYREFYSDDFYNIFNLVFPKSITVLELAQTILSIAKKYIDTKSEVKIFDDKKEILNKPNEKDLFYFDVSKAKKFLDIEELEEPKQILENIIRARISGNKTII